MRSEEEVRERLYRVKWVAIGNPDPKELEIRRDELEWVLGGEVEPLRGGSYDEMVKKINELVGMVNELRGKV